MASGMRQLAGTKTSYLRARSPDSFLASPFLGDLIMSKIGAARSNRFHRHPIRTGLGVAFVFLLLIEAASTLVAWGMGHSSRRARYEPNRIISGYTVYRHSPGFDFGMSTIRKTPDEPSVVLDDNGFICDEVITQKKPDGVVRIFLMGGSTAISSGQTDIYSGPYKYPWGIYSYRHSIAGQLRDFLEEQVPEAQVQVITAAAFGRRIHQSLVEYLATISRFSPDIVVTLDGMNDLGSQVTGSPWADAESELPQYIDLWSEHYRRPLWRKTSTEYVLSRSFRRLGWLDRHESASSQSHTTFDDSIEAYRQHRDSFVEASEVYLRTLRHFQVSVNSDGAAFVAAIQPMLHRRGANKELSILEQKFDSLNLAEVLPLREKGLTHLVNRYFFDDYLSHTIAEEIHGPRAVVVDCNQELRSVGRDVEFYTDYCHLTFEGNRITAEILGRACLPFLNPITD